MSMDMNSLVSSWQGTPCTIRNSISSSKVVLEESCAAVASVQRNFSLSRKLTLALISQHSLVSHAADNGINANSMPHSWNGLRCNEIVVILSMMPDFVPAIHLPPRSIMYKILHSFADGFE